jgi:hypothetical protein
MMQLLKNFKQVILGVVEGIQQFRLYKKGKVK